MLSMKSAAGRRARRGGTALLIALTTVAALWLVGRPVAALTTLGADDTAVDRAVLDRFARVGVASYDCASGEVRVVRAWWSAIDWEGKLTLVERVERVCGSRPTRPVIVHDVATGRELTLARPGWLDLDR